MSEKLSDLMKTISEDAGKPDESVSLEEITSLSDKQIELEGLIFEAEEALKKLKDEHKEISAYKLPRALESSGLRSLQLSNGKSIEVSEKVFISVPKNRLSEIVERVKEMGYKEAVKDCLEIDCGKGEGQRALEIEKLAQSFGFDSKMVSTINSATLKKILMERREQGIEDDLKLYGCYVAKQSIIK